MRRFRDHGRLAHGHFHGGELYRERRRSGRRRAHAASPPSSPARLFVVALFLAPVVGAIPAAATAPALIVVGSLMMTVVAEVKWDDPEVAVPAFLTMMTIPLTFSIANGLAFGFTAYTLLKVVRGKFRQVNWFVYLLTALFMARFVYLARVRMGHGRQSPEGRRPLAAIAVFQATAAPLEARPGGGLVPAAGRTSAALSGDFRKPGGRPSASPRPGRGPDAPG